MANKHLPHFSIPQDFNHILSDFTREILRDQPSDIIEYAAQYFETLAAGKEWKYSSKTNVPSSNVRSSFTPQSRNPENKPSSQHSREPSTQNKNEEKSGSKKFSEQYNDAELESNSPINSPFQNNSSRIDEDYDQRYKYLNIANGERLAYIEDGETNSRCIILLHSNLSSSEIWAPIIPYLAERYHIYAIDLRGSGRSSYHTKLYHMRDLADDVVQFMEALEIESASFVGHYTGAGVAMTLAFRYTYKIEKLIILGPLAIKGFIYEVHGVKDIQPENFLSNDSVASIQEALQKKDRAFFEKIIGSTIYSNNIPDDERFDRILNDTLKCRSYLDLLYVMSRYNISNDSNGIVEGNGGISLIESDVLILHGFDDQIAPLEASKEIKEALGPKAELMTIKNGAHALMDTNSSEVVDNILEFIDRPPSHHKYAKLPNGETIAYMESGIYNQKVVIFLHGNLASSQSWDVVFPKLEGEFHVIAIDLRGYGRSTYNTPVKDLRDFADDVEAFMEAIQLEKASFYGDFMGAGIALLMAIKDSSKVERLVLMSPISPKGFVHKIEGVDSPQPEDFLKDQGVSMIYDALMSQNKDFFKKALLESSYSGHPPSIERFDLYLNDILQCKAYLDTLYAMSRFNISKESNGITDGTGEIDQVRSKVLIIQGENDKQISIDTNQELLKALSDLAQLEIIKDASHSFLETHLTQVAGVVTKFLRLKN